MEIIKQIIDYLNSLKNTAEKDDAKKEFSETVYKILITIAAYTITTDDNAQQKKHNLSFVLWHVIHNIKKTTYDLSMIIAYLKHLGADPCKQFTGSKNKQKSLPTAIAMAEELVETLSPEFQRVIKLLKSTQPGLKDIPDYILTHDAIKITKQCIIHGIKKAKEALIRSLTVKELVPAYYHLINDNLDNDAELQKYSEQLVTECQNKSLVNTALLDLFLKFAAEDKYTPIKIIISKSSSELVEQFRKTPSSYAIRLTISEDIPPKDLSLNILGVLITKTCTNTKDPAELLSAIELLLQLGFTIDPHLALYALLFRSETAFDILLKGGVNLFAESPVFPSTFKQALIEIDDSKVAKLCHKMLEHPIDFKFIKNGELLDLAFAAINQGKNDNEDTLLITIKLIKLQFSAFKNNSITHEEQIKILKCRNVMSINGSYLAIFAILIRYKENEIFEQLLAFKTEFNLNKTFTIYTNKNFIVERFDAKYEFIAPYQINLVTHSIMVDNLTAFKLLVEKHGYSINRTEPEQDLTPLICALLVVDDNIQKSEYIRILQNKQVNMSERDKRFNKLPIYYVTTGNYDLENLAEWLAPAQPQDMHDCLALLPNAALSYATHLELLQQCPFIQLDRLIASISRLIADPSEANYKFTLTFLEKAYASSNNKFKPSPQTNNYLFIFFIYIWYTNIIYVPGKNDTNSTEGIRVTTDKIFNNYSNQELIPKIYQAVTVNNNIMRLYLDPKFFNDNVELVHKIGALLASNLDSLYMNIKIPRFEQEFFLCPLTFLSLLGDAALLKILLKDKSLSSGNHSTNKNVLIIATKEKHAECVKILLTTPGDEFTTVEIMSALIYAIKNDDISTTKTIIDYAKNKDMLEHIYKRTNDTTLPLKAAVIKASVPLLRVVLEAIAPYQSQLDLQDQLIQLANLTNNAEQQEIFALLKEYILPQTDKLAPAQASPVINAYPATFYTHQDESKRRIAPFKDEYDNIKHVLVDQKFPTDVVDKLEKRLEDNYDRGFVSNNFKYVSNIAKYGTADYKMKGVKGTNLGNSRVLFFPLKENVTIPPDKENTKSTTIYVEYIARLSPKH